MGFLQTRVYLEGHTLDAPATTNLVRLKAGFLLAAKDAMVSNARTEACVKIVHSKQVIFILQCLGHWKTQKVFRVIRVVKEVIPGEGNYGIFRATLMCRIILQKEIIFRYTNKE